MQPSQQYSIFVVGLKNEEAWPKWLLLMATGRL